MTTEDKPKLEFILGDETRPKVEIKDELVGSFFRDAYQKSFNLIGKIVDEMGEEETDQGGEYYQNVRNNIIAFVGERGSGKTSCLQSVFQYLTRCQYHTGGRDKDTIKNVKESFGIKWDTTKTEFRSLPTIDPSYFEEGNNILEIIIANMFRTFKEEANKPGVAANWNDNDSKYLEIKRTLVKAFQQTKDALDQINKQNRKDTNDSIEALSSLATGTNMKKCMMDLVKFYLDYFQGHILVIAIDDIDIQTKYAFKMVEQIRKYLMIPKDIILTGVKLVQLSDIIKQTFMDDYKSLGKENLSDSIENMVGRYLSKIIPYNHRIFLPDVAVDVTQRKLIIKEDKDKALERFDSIDQGILHLIFRRTRYLFYNSATGVSRIVPRNLRDVLNLVALLYSMEEVPDHDNEENNIHRAIINKNRAIFRSYFIETWCNENLRSEHFLFIQDLISSEVGNINKKIVDYLSDICRKFSLNYDKSVAYPGNRAYNISLGDVDYFLDKVYSIKSQKTVNYGQFGFALRTVYSMFLYEACENQKSSSGDEVEVSFINRIGTFKAKYRSAESKALIKENKLSIYSNYERLLGGLLIKWGDPYAKLHDNTNIGNEREVLWRNSFPRLFHYHPINKQKLQEIYENRADDSLYLQICEFFLLNTVSEEQSSYFRSKRHCYYDNLPHETIHKEEDTQVVFHSLAILSNLVKYYNFYKQYNKFKEDAAIVIEENLTAFWSIGKTKDSLIHKLLFYLIDNTKEFNHNKAVEEVFIRNLEILDSLHDYLSPSIGSRILKVEDAEKADRRYIVYELIALYSKLSKFDYYLYPKKKNPKTDEPPLHNIAKTFTIFNDIVEFLKDILYNNVALDSFNEVFMGILPQEEKEKEEEEEKEKEEDEEKDEDEDEDEDKDEDENEDKEKDEDVKNNIEKIAPHKKIDKEIQKYLNKIQKVPNRRNK